MERTLPEKVQNYKRKRGGDTEESIKEKELIA
jgi:hypothetical protein